MHNSIIEELAKVPEVIFVGGTSEYLQGIKNTIRDIDISIDDISRLRHIGHFYLLEDNSFYGLSGKRGILKKHDIWIDAFIDNHPIDYIITPQGYKCETVQSMITLREKTIEKGLLQGEPLKKIQNNLNRLKQWEH